MADRERILRHLHQQRATLHERFTAFTDAELTTPCTTSEDPDGEDWTPKDHLAHLIRIERAFLGMARMTLDGDRAPIKIPGATFEERLAAVHRENETHIASMRDRSVAELLASLDADRADTIAFIDAATDEQLDTPIPGAPWGDGTIGGVLHTNSLHEMQHLAWIDEGMAARS